MKQFKNTKFPYDQKKAKSKKKIDELSDTWPS